MMTNNAVQPEAIKSFIESYNNIFGRKVMEEKHLPTGNEVLDDVLKGGYKKGSLTELSGVTDSGKTFLALKAIKEMQDSEEDKIAIYINANNNLTNEMFADNEINTDSVLIINSNHADNLGPILSEIKPNIADIGLIILDDVASLTTTKEQTTSLKSNTDIHRSKVIKSLLTRISNMVRNTEACALILNQERTNYINNDVQGTVSSSERWIDMCCDTRVKLTKNEDGDTSVEVNFKERKIK